jgi:hypothetical protein
MNDPISFDPERDLHHFLRLAQMQLQHRIKETKTAAAAAAPPATKPPSRGRELTRLQLLEELIKEQLPNDNIGAATGTSR